jgi:hypothetical protein
MPVPATAIVKPFKEVTLDSPITIDRPRVFVNPPTLHLGSGNERLKTIVWVNHTGGDVLLWLPNAFNYIEGKPEDFLAAVHIPSGGKLPLAVRSNCVDGYYHYNAFCKAIGGYAEGNSEPGVSCP